MALWFSDMLQAVLELRKVRGSLTQQRTLCEEAAMEPELCWGEFRRDLFEEILVLEEQLIKV